MLTVHGFVPDWGLADLSPFVVKLETWLRLAKIPYRRALGDPRRAPKKKLPYIVDDDGRTIADSDAIIRHLKATRDITLDAHLDPRTAAIGEAVRALLEEHHYFVIVYVRWCIAESRRVYRPTLLRYYEGLGIPRFLHGLVFAAAVRDLQGQAYKQGVARHSEAEIMEIGKRHFSAVADVLGDQPFLLGDRPSSVDATVYAFLASTTCAPFETPIKAHALADPRLVAYRDRMRELCWSADPPAA